MSSELKTLLHNAATVPHADPDLAGALRRGRALRVRRRATSTFAAVVLVVAGAVAVTALANPTSNRSLQGSAAVPSCRAVSTATNDVPSWAAPAHPPTGVPHVLSRERNAIAFLFGYPLRAGHPMNRTNKILWIVREPRNGRPLVVSGALGGRTSTVHASFPANSSPGQIYPSTINVPSPGCWHFALRWNGHGARFNLEYQSAT